MSSIQENATVPLDVVDKPKANFSRSDSFDKLHYTAFYTIQLASEFHLISFLFLFMFRNYPMRLSKS